MINDILNEIKLKIGKEEDIIVAVCGQMHGFVAWDSDFKPVTNLVTWQDRRLPLSECESLNLQPGYGVGSLVWFRKNKPNLLSNAVSCGTIMGWFTICIQ